MADVSHWERAFVNSYVVASKRDRYLSFLNGPKHRQKILDRLNHSLDYVQRFATTLESRFKTADALMQLLAGRGVDPNWCSIMADGNPSDGTSMRLDRAVPELLDNHWGAVIICPPKPIAVYKSEDIGDLILLG